MNSCVLMATIISDPELRKTTGDLSVTEMLVEFDNLQPDGSLGTMRVVALGNLAEEVKENYSSGDRIIVAGRLSMNTIEIQQGSNRYKEKKAELVISRIQAVGHGDFPSSSSAKVASKTETDNFVSSSSNKKPTSEKSERTVVPFSSPKTETVKTSTSTSFEPEGKELDDIPF